VEFRDVGKRVVDVAIERTLNILGVNVGAECVVDHRYHLVEVIGLLSTDVVDAREFVIGGEFAGPGDIVDVCEITGLGTVAEQLGGLAVGDGVSELCDRVGVLAFVFLVAAESLIHRKEAEPCHRHIVVVGVVLGVAFAGEFRSLVAGVSLDGHTLRRGLGPTAVDRGGRRIDNCVTPLFTDLFDGVDESFDVDPTATLGVLLVHVPRGERYDMKEDVDVRWKVVVEDRRLDEFDRIREISGDSEVGVVDGDHVVVSGEMVGEVRSDEPRATGDEHTFVLHTRIFVVDSLLLQYDFAD